MIPKESGKGKANKGRMVWEIYEIRGHIILIMGIYWQANGGGDQKNEQLNEEEVFEVLDTENYDKIIMVWDWNVFLNQNIDQKTTETRKVQN